MKSVRLICVLLLSVFVLTTYAIAFDIEHGNSSVTITNSSPRIELTLTKGDGFIKFNLITVSKTVTLFRGTGDNHGEAQIKCTSNSTGNVTTLSKKGYEIVSLLMSNVDFQSLDGEYAEFLRSVLNLLESWPSNLPVCISTDSEKTTYVTSENEPAVIEHQNTLRGHVPPSGKELDPPPPHNDSLCPYQGEIIYGHVLYFGDPLPYGQREAWTEDFTGRIRL